MKPTTFATLLALAISSASAATPDGRQKLVLIAGKPSHPPGMHEFRAGTMLLEKCLKAVPGLMVDRHDMGWVSDEATFADADAVVIYADGGGKHPAVVDGHLETLRGLMAKGVIGRLHKRRVISRQADPADGRRTLWRLTASGERLLARTVAVGEATTNKTIAPLAPKERKTVLDLLSRLT